MSTSPMIIYRTTDALKWGDGKGANLTPHEVDANLYALAKAIEAVELTEPHNITAIEVTGNKMTIRLDGGASFGPFALPTASLRFRGAWLPSTDYLFGDFFTAADGLYVSNYDHTSDTSFSDAASNGRGPLYTLIMPFPKIYDIGFFYPGIVGSGLASGDTMLSHVAGRAFYLPAGLTGSLGKLESAAASDMFMGIRKGATDIGHVSIAAGAKVAAFSFSADVQFSTGDVLKVLRPVVMDASAKALTLTLLARLGTAPVTP